MTDYYVEIQRIIPFTGEGHGIAGVTFQCGPFIIHGKLFEKEGRRWLSMPCRKGSDDKWHDTVYFVDKGLQGRVEKAALAAYDREVNLPSEMHPALQPEPAGVA